MKQDKQEKKEKKLREKEEKEQKKREKKGKKLKEPKPKKPKSEGYVMKKNTGLKVARVVLWLMLGFIFVRGVISCFHRDKEAQVNALIQNFKATYNQFTGENGEVLSFAQNFAKEYLTYSVRGEDEYKKRLAEYVATNFFNDSTQNFTSAAEALYVEAYRLEEYSPVQKDVYVRAEVEYTKRTQQSGTSYTEEVCRMPITLKVPVYCNKDGTYAVECIPQVVSDSVLNKYGAEEYHGTILPEEESDKIQVSVENFLLALCEQDESVIDYYLDPSAKRDDFTGLSGRVNYLNIEAIQCYQNEGEQDIICIVKYMIQDTGNDIKLLQKINLTVHKTGERYYIKDMNTRTGNLNLN